MITPKYIWWSRAIWSRWCFSKGPPSTPGWLLKLTRGARHTYDHNHTTHTFTKENGSAVSVTMTMTMVLMMIMMIIMIIMTLSFPKAVKILYTLLYMPHIIVGFCPSTKHGDLLAVIRIGGSFMGVRVVEWGLGALSWLEQVRLFVQIILQVPHISYKFNWIVNVVWM